MLVQVRVVAAICGTWQE